MSPRVPVVVMSRASLPWRGFVTLAETGLQPAPREPSPTLPTPRLMGPIFFRVQRCQPVAHSRSLVSATLPLLLNTNKTVVAVPTMGDSITEGTIVEWIAQVGQAVRPDDVVALIETDKVTVEIKANVEGVITQHFGAVDDTVEVGAQLYEIDTEAEASVAPAELVEASGFPPAVDDAEHLTSSSPKAEAAPSADAAPRHRIPSIHFLQKEGWAKRKAGSSCAAAPGAPEPSPATATPGAVSTSSPLAVTTYEVDSLPPSYGRPKLSHAEMDALVYGGANLLDAQ